MVWFALIAWLACADDVPESTKVDRSFALVYSGNVHGEIEPCG